MRPGRPSGVLPCLALASSACALLLGLRAAASALGSGFENPVSNDSSQQFGIANVQRQDAPNDPCSDCAEPGDTNTRSCGPATHSSNLDDERYDLFGFASQLTRSSAIYKDGPNV